MVRLLLAASLLLLACSPAARPAAPSAPGQPQPAGAAPAATTAVDPFTEAKSLSLDELYARALPEGGVLSFYGTLSPASAAGVYPAFEQRFPGIKVEQFDGTGEQLLARIVAEARGGKVFADHFQVPIAQIQLANQQGLLLQDVPPEAMAFPENLRGRYWVATALQFIVAAWNTNLVRPEEAPRSFEDFADPRWRNRLMLEPEDLELLAGLAQHKYRNDEQAVELLRKIAANNPEFHKGHSELIELLVAGQAAACLTCYSNHPPPRIRRGAPLDYLLTEGIGLIIASAVPRDAPHPYTAMLWHRWLHTEHGQQAYADGGRAPAHPNVPPLERIRPERIYPVGGEDMAARGKYERLWKEIFQLR